MDIIATSKYIRVSPRKLDLLVKSVRDLKPTQAVATLAYINKSGAAPLKKVIVSALANAKQQKIGTDLLTFKEIQVLSGSGMKRFRPVSRGMAHSYKKRMAHVKVILTETKPSVAEVKKETVEKTEEKSS